ncbi:AarF/ABC1/UbiB kinase family protein [Nocardia terpenica]|uniref:ABC1 kinase family protein n=1 Tax=Nocardia terpenica TaxID=455432 RepID=UPI001893EF3A|nr:AarF/ABC1/UbiB kinase family protein [Nocardia terpenica]MBF6061957.1 AarF/ABC1/UbiB kinase family protein [Nocardia terpenica]MBF6106243.1 AarF/ABC1/UbiB kinase family protein [Nocardia terpenica]MBF6110377.1 AarF/ABC1/UbiB kinase family protein [Nocardia terpenica]MBF6120786.1 AarF/ABC1/UbiB kinase family protein [Nocardia terpenica]MBF6151713.1 AarF/ABC1/UbiB kinase family protein [Nocardia terpenica]
MTEMPRSRARRAAQLGGFVGTEAVRRAAAKAAPGRTRPDEQVAAAEQARNALLAERLVAVLGTMRGAAMKLGQMLSLVDPGLVPPAHRELFHSALAALQDSAPPMAWDRMRTHLERELGAELGSVFAEFEPEPVAAASIGQVYRARLADGRRVAVKVQYPEIEAAVRADLKNLRVLLSAYRFVHPALDAPALADEVQLRLEEELDYRIEASNTRAMGEIFQGHPFIRIPDVHQALSGQRVIVTEWLDGQPLRAAYTAAESERNRIAEILFRFYCGTTYLAGFFNGDPHPGNVLLLEDGSIGFLDFGLCMTVDAEAAAGELAALRAAKTGDAERLLQLMEVRGFARRSAVPAGQAIEVFLRVFGWYLRDEPMRIGPDIANDVVALLTVTGPGVSARSFNLPAAHALRGRAELQLVAILGQLGPRLNMHAVAREWLFGAEPVTELGRAHRDWVAHRTGNAPSMPPTSVIFQPESRSTVR